MLKILVSLVCLLCLSTVSLGAERCYNQPVRTSKVPLFVSSKCAPGYGLNGVIFSRNEGNVFNDLDKNLTYKELYRLRCCRVRPRLVTRQAKPADFVSKHELTSRDSTGPNRYATGLEFSHDSGKDYTHQESFRLVKSRRVRAQVKFSRCYKTRSRRKRANPSVFRCRRNDLVKAITFKHALHQNETHQEAVSLDCCTQR